MPQEIEENEQIDIRLYIGMVFFHWKTIVVCFLYALLGGVLYIDFTAPQYQASCAISIYRDPLTTVTSAAGQWARPSTHAQLLASADSRNRTVDQLFDDWSEQVGGRQAMNLPVSARPGRSSVVISVKSVNREYAIVFLDTLLAQHEVQWKSKQRQSRSNAMKALLAEVALTEEKIEEAQNNIIEYIRLNDLTRQTIRASVEEGFIKRIMHRRTALETELFMMETAHPDLKNANLAVISAVDSMASGIVSSEPSKLDQAGGATGRVVDDDAWLKDAFAEDDAAKDAAVSTKNKDNEDDMTGLVSLRLTLLSLNDEKAALEQNLTADHPRVRAVDAQIKRITDQLKHSAKLKLMSLKDKHKSMLILLKSLESMEYKWQAKRLQSMVKETELARFQDQLTRYKKNYSTLYARYHETKIAEETNTERFSIVRQASANEKPAWPDPTKILLVSLVIGLGAGFGISFLMQFLDNKIQSIKDVEKDLKVKFLGGVPYWVHSGLESTVRPIVTEEHSSGAVEAYRALRTVLIAELAKRNEKIVFVSSADSREGKTLTTLNLAIMTAQMDKKVLMIDMDLRRGRLHRSLGVPKSPGVTDALRDKRSIKDVVVSTRVENLDLAPTGKTYDGSSELLQSVDLMSMFVELQDDYDYIFIDTSPILRVTDTVIMTTQGIGVVVYVARINHTSKPLIRYSLDMLQEADVLGLIMNSIEMHKINSLYYAYQYPNYAYYSNAYAYGYDYYNYGDQKGQAAKFRRKNPLQEASKSAKRWFRNAFS